MAITKLDTVAALVAIDLQKGLAGIPAVHPMAEIVSRTARLARTFRDRGLPVVLVNVTGGPSGRTDVARPKFTLPPDWTELIPELDIQPADHQVAKQCWGAFSGTGLHDFLQERRVTQIVLTGVATSIGVESTARSAYDLGYNVALVVDAMTDRDAESHRYSIEKIFPRLGETTTTDQLLSALERTTEDPG